MPAIYSGLQPYAKAAGLSVSLGGTPSTLLPLYDVSSGWQPGDMLFDTYSGNIFRCLANTVSAAVWVPVSDITTVKAVGQNFNITTDQATVVPVTATGFAYLDKVIVANASISLTTAAGGIYSAASKGGTALVAAAQTYATLTGSTIVAELTIAARLKLVSGSSVYLNLTTAQGAAATADVYYEFKTLT